MTLVQTVPTCIAGLDSNPAGNFAINQFGHLFEGSGGEYRSQQIADCVRDPKCHRIFVVDHRAKGWDAPENSRAAVRKAVDEGMPVIEIDLRLSKDGETFVLHDGKLDRTTSLTGEISELTSKQLEAALLKNGEPLPRFREIYEISKGRAVLDLHLKSNAVETVSEWIALNGSFDDVIFCVTGADQEADAARMMKKYPSMLVMPLLRSQSEWENISRFFAAGSVILQPTHFPSKKLLREMRATGSKVFVNIFAEEYAGILESWKIRRLINFPVDFIQTDRPKWLLKKIQNIP